MHGLAVAHVSMQTQSMEWAAAIAHTPICKVGIVVRTCPWWYYLRGVAPLPTVHWCETTSSNEGTAVLYSMQCCRGQDFSEHTCWWNNTVGRAGSPRGFTPHSPALSTFFRRAGMKPPNSTGMCQMPTSQPRRTSPGGKCMQIHRCVFFFLLMLLTAC